MKKLCLILWGWVGLGCGWTGFGASALEICASDTVSNPSLVIPSVVPHEKIYLTLDRDEVQPGDTLLVSGLVVDARQFGVPYSRYVHVEWLDSRDSLVARQKLSAEDGLFCTRMPVDTFLMPGIYYVRAYTRWMRNAPAWTFPMLPVGIGRRVAMPRPAATGDVGSVRFYPEGGRLVAGVPQQVMFEVADANGNPLRASGDLIDEKGTLVATGVGSYADGRGLLRFLPRAGMKYALRLKGPAQEKEVLYPLPDAGELPSIRMNINRGRLRYELTMGPEREGNYRFALFFRGSFCFEDTLSARHPAGVVGINNQPAGLYAGVLRDEGGTALAERLIFWPAGGEVSVSSGTLETDREVYAPGALAYVRLDSVSGAEVAGRYLVRWVEKPGVEEEAAGQQGSVGSGAEGLGFETLASYLWISSELEVPLAYRRGMRLTGGELDLRAVERLLLGCRWKRDSLATLGQQPPARLFEPETVMTLSGRVETELGNRFKKGGSMVALDAANGLTYTGEITADSRFRMGVDDFLDGHSFFMQAYNPKGKSYNFRIYPEEETYPAVVNPLRVFWERKDGAVLRSEAEPEEEEVRAFGQGKGKERHYRLQEVEITGRARKKQKAVNRYYEPFLITEQMLRESVYGDLVPYLERFVGLVVKKLPLYSGEEPKNPLSYRYGLFTTRGASVLRGVDDPYSYQVDEIPVLLDGFLIDTHLVLTTLHPQNVVSIQRLTPAQALAYTSHGMNGAVLIKTHGNNGSLFVSKGIHHHPEGLSPLALPAPSLPCTLRVPDKEGVYLIVAEGIDGEGNPRRFTREIRVVR